MLGHPIRGRTTSSISRNSLRMGDYRRPKLFLLMQPLTCIGSCVRWCNNTSFLLKLKDGERGFRYGSCFSCYTNVRSEISGPASSLYLRCRKDWKRKQLAPQWEPSSQVQIIEKVIICPPLEGVRGRKNALHLESLCLSCRKDWKEQAACPPTPSKGGHVFSSPNPLGEGDHD